MAMMLDYLFIFKQEPAENILIYECVNQEEEQTFLFQIAWISHQWLRTCEQW